MTTATATSTAEKRRRLTAGERAARAAETEMRAVKARLDTAVMELQLAEIEKLAGRARGRSIGQVGVNRVPGSPNAKKNAVRVGASGLPRPSAFAGSYTATKQSRLRSGTAGVSGLGSLHSSDEHLDPFTRVGLAAISQNLLRNSPTARAIVNRLARLIVGGNGFTFRATTDDPEVNKAYEQYIGQWSEECDARGMRYLPQLEEIWSRLCFRDGDVLVVFTAAGKLQTVEAARVRSFGISKANPANANTAAPDPGNTVVDGVELSPEGEPVAYYVVNKSASPVANAAANPAGVRTARPAPNNVGTVVRVPASMAVLIANPLSEFASSTRGEPLLAATAGAIDDIGDTLDSTLVAIHATAMHALMIKTANPEATKESLIGSAVTAEGSDGSETQRETVVTPGSIVHLKPGEDVEAVQPSQPGPNFQQFYDTIVRMICADVGIAPELAMFDFTKANFYGNRAAMVAMWNSTVEPVQRCLAADLKKISRWRIGLAIEDGVLPYHKDFANHSWSGPTMPAIDEMAEFKAKKFGVDAKLLPWAQAVKDLGGNPEHVAAELRDDEKLLAGIDVPLSQGLTFGSNGGKADAAPGTEFVDAGANAGETAANSA